VHKVAPSHRQYHSATSGFAKRENARGTALKIGSITG
jgi:hypothetical protein